MRTSYSSLDTYRTCPLKYKLQNIDKIKTPKGIEAVFGTLVHSALNYMFERDPLYPTEEEVVGYFTDRFKDSMDKVVWEFPDKREAQEKLFFNEGIRIIKSFYKKNPPWNFNVVELEGRFSIPLEDEQSGETHTLAGFIDRIDKDVDTGEYEIIDYKTGKRMPSETDLEENLQLGLYHLALTVRWPSIDPSKIRTSLYFLKHNEKVGIVPSKELQERTKDSILEIIRNIEESEKAGDFPPTPGPLCGWCGFKKICPMFSHEYSKVEKPAPNEKELTAAVERFFEIKASEDANKRQLTELRNTILGYMDDQHVDRVFGDRGYITRNIQDRYSYDIEKIEPVLRKSGKWSELLVPDTKKLEKIVDTLSKKEKEELLALRTKKSFTVLKQTKKKNSEDTDDEK